MTSSTLSNEDFVLEVARKFFVNPIPDRVMAAQIRNAIAVDQHIDSHAAIAERYGHAVYAMAFERLVPSAYFDPRNADHLERECQRVVNMTTTDDEDGEVTFKPVEDDSPW